MKNWIAKLRNLNDKTFFLVFLLCLIGLNLVRFVTNISHLSIAKYNTTTFGALK